MPDKNSECISPQSHYILPADRTSKKKRLFWSILITFLIMLLEGLGGLFTKSLALISDAGHMLTHFVALGISLFAIIIAEKPPTEEKTFGYLRFEILAALFNSVFLFALTGYIIYEAYERMHNPIPIKGIEMFAVAFLGLVANLITGLILFKVSHGDLNIRSAFLHLVGDTISSVGVVIAAVIIHFTGLFLLDTVISLVIAVLIAIWGVRLFLESVNILLQGIPKEVRISSLNERITQVEGVNGIHDTHVWAISSKMNVFTAHIVIDNISVSETEKLLRDINKILLDEFNIFHTTIQFETERKNRTHV
ncbi:MAG TPA: cation transporter [Firmicutes bacterium]|nr:cation transporter [Bacillota bacterium]